MIHQWRNPVGQDAILSPLGKRQFVWNTARFFDPSNFGERGLLAWKTLKDFLEDQGYIDLNSPRAVLKKAFEVELIADGHDWLKILRDRNLMTHTYDEATAIAVEELIRDTYYPLLETLQETMLKIDSAEDRP